jgi:hypothetical protein
MNTLMEYVRGAISCPICMTTIAPPLMACTLGHSVCRACTQQLVSQKQEPTCPICRTSYGEELQLRLKPVERMARDLVVTCEQAGCQMQCTYGELTEHRLYGCTAGNACDCHHRAVVQGGFAHLHTCKFAGMRCLSEDCMWTGARGTYADHLREQHAEDYLWAQRTNSETSYQLIDSNQLNPLAIADSLEDPNDADLLAFEFKMKNVVYCDEDSMIEIVFHMYNDTLVQALPVVIYSPTGNHAVLDLKVNWTNSQERRNLEFTYIGDLMEWDRQTSSCSNALDTGDTRGIFIMWDTIIKVRESHVIGPVEEFAVSFRLWPFEVIY